MRVLEDNYGWGPIDGAPFDKDVTVQVTDGRGGPYCGIRGNAATDSDGKRPPNPIESGHLIRTNADTLLMG